VKKAQIVKKISQKTRKVAKDNHQKQGCKFRQKILSESEEFKKI